MAGIQRRAVGGGQVCGVKQVLDPQRQAVQRTAQRATVQRAGPRQGGIAVQRGKGMNIALALVDALQAGAHQVFRCQFTTGQQGGGLPSV